jgi:hypothetical protein
MGGLLAFLLILIIIVGFVLISIVGSILGGFVNLFRSGRRAGPASGANRNATSTTGQAQSQEGVRRMKKFKNAAEDADYEILDEE